MPASHTLDRVRVSFDDERVVANAGLVLPATLASKLGLESVVDDMVDLGGRPGAANAGAKASTVIFGMLAGARCIDDLDVLRAGSTGRILPFSVAAPSTVGTWLRSFSFGHVRQLDRVLDRLLQLSWSAGAGPGQEPLVIDIDSSICEVHGYLKQGATYGYSRVRGYHPLIATRADTTEVLHVRLRKGSANTQRGIIRFVEELIARVRRAGATGPIVIRADSGFWSNQLFKACRRLDVRFSVTVTRQKPIIELIDRIDDDAWVDIDYPGIAQVAETPYRGMRLIVRRVRNANDDLALFETWRHHAFLTDRTGTPVELDHDHRAHAVVELAIRELKDNGLARLPSGKFAANAAWTVLAAIAHNLARWTSILGTNDLRLVTAKTLRTRLLALPGRLTRTARRWKLHLPSRWPWQHVFEDTLERLRALPAPM
jgi:hypothetical protein